MPGGLTEEERQQIRDRYRGHGYEMRNPTGDFRSLTLNSQSALEGLDSVSRSM